MIDNAKTIVKETQDSITPSQALQILKDGNKRFLESSSLDRDLRQQVEQTASGQYPFAAILGCIDSRVPSELVFDQGIGDIFNVRIAGNFVNKDILGSLEFACKVAGSKIILVLGHTQCGAVKGACDNVQLGNLTGMLEKIKPAVDGVSDIVDDRTSKNSDFVQKVADLNVKLAIKDIREQSEILKEMESQDEIAIVGAMYDVNTGKVKFLD